MINDKPVIASFYNIKCYKFKSTGNIYTMKDFSEEQAIEAEASNHKCKNCIDCINCYNCSGCFECENCEDCVDCHESKNLIQCDNCRNCNTCYNIPSDFTEDTFSDATGVININDEEKAIATFSKLKLRKN